MEDLTEKIEYADNPKRFKWCKEKELGGGTKIIRGKRVLCGGVYGPEDKIADGCFECVNYEKN